MTKPLPERDVAARATRLGKARLTDAERKILGRVPPELQQVIGELLISTRQSQENFQTIEQWFPIQPADIARKNENQGEADESGLWLKWLRKGTSKAVSTIRGIFSKESGFHELRMAVQAEPNNATREADIRIFANDKEDNAGIELVVGGGSRYLLRRQAGSTAQSDFLQLYSKRQLPSGSITKGGLITADSVDNPRILAVGEDGKILVANSAKEAGLQWKTPEEAGLKGLEGRWAGLKYTWLTNTEVTDPGSGKAKRSSTNSALRISETDKDGNSVAAFLATWDDSSTAANRGTIIVRQVGSPKRFRILKITGALTDEGTWDSIPTELIAEGEALENEKEVAIEWFRTGDQGEKGATGDKGAEGRSAGFKYVYSTNVESSDPGSGKLKFNKATLSEATLLRISETDGDGNSIAAFLATIDDSTSNVKGTITLRKVAEPSKFAIFQTSGVLSDNGTWDSLTVAHIASNGLVNNDVVSVEFDRTGDKGEQGEKGEVGKGGIFLYKYQRSATAVTECASERWRGNNEQITKITAIAVGPGDVNSAGSAASFSEVLRRVGIGAILVFRSRTQPGCTISFRVEEAPVLNGDGSVRFPSLSRLSVASSFGEFFQENEEFYVGVVPTGTSGTAEVEWPAASEKNASNILTVTHNLGYVPVVSLTPQASEGSETLISARVIEGSKTNTQFKMRAYAGVPIAKGTKLKIDWTAS